MGFEDEASEPVDEIEVANLYAENKRKEQADRQAESLIKMEQNRLEHEAQQKTEQIAREKLQALSKTLGVDQIREDIDLVKTQVGYLAERMGDSIKAINNLSAVIQGGQTPQAQTEQQVTPTARWQMLGELLQSPLGDKILSKLIPDQQTAPSFWIDPQTLQEKAKQAFFDNLETGDSINGFIKNALKQKATKIVINKALSNLNMNTDSDEPA